MSLELYFSNQLEQLGQKLSENLKDESNKSENIFKRPTIIVPNSNLKKWLQMAVADNLGIAINLEFSFLEEGLWNMLGALDRSCQTVELVNNEIRQLLLLYLFQNHRDGNSKISLIKNYLFGTDEEKRDDYIKRAWQLSKRLAYYFREYEYHRPDMIKRWQSDSKDEDQLNEVELCQSYIYNRLFHPVDGLCTNINGKQFMTLTQYAYKIINSMKNRMEESKTNIVQRNAHLFGLSQVSVFHQYLIGNLGNYFNIYIYAFNPCCEFWEDIETPGERRWRIKKSMEYFKISDNEVDAGELKDADNLLLQWWGKPGRENIRLLSELTNYNFYELYCLNDAQNIGSDTVLQRLQRYILFRASAGDGKYFPVHQDCSLQIVACPGLYREVETVYNSIIHNMEGDKTINLTDIAILIPDMKKYKTAITSVFNRRPAHIPYNLCDSTAEKESVFGQAVIGLLRLAEGSFNRKEVFSVIFNPCFLNKFNLSRDEVQVWVSWADALNIFHGFDAQDKKRQGYSENMVHTWRHGLRRLRMARIMNTPNDVHISGRFEDYMGVIPFDISSSGDMALLERFCEIIELLFARIQRLRKGKLSCRDWAERISCLIDEFLSIPDEHSNEECVRQSLFDGLKSLQLYDKLLFHSSTLNQLKSPHPPFNTSLVPSNKGREGGGVSPSLIGGMEGNGFFELAMITEFIKEKLMSIPGGYGSYLTGGVTISEMRPMRPVPFKIVYVMGMGEGEFPGRANQSILDLRLMKRRIGDISIPETNCYTFLETLVSTRKKLYLTFISKDLQTDEEFVPCSVIHQLKQYIESEVFAGKENFEIMYIPLKGSDINYLYKKANNISDVLVNYSEADRLSFYVENDLINSVKNRLNDNELKRWERFEPDFNLREMDSESRSEIEGVTLQMLRQFLENPAEASIRRHLNLYEDDNADKSLAENEPFYTEFPFDYNIVMNSMEYCVNRRLKSDLVEKQDEIINFMENYYKYNFLKGMTPEDDFSERDKREFEKTLKERFSGLLKIIKQIEKALKWSRWIFFGDGNLKDAGNKKLGEFMEFDPLRLEIDVSGKDSTLPGQKIDIHGSLPMVWQDENGWNSLVITTRKKSDGKLPEKYVIEPFLFYLMALLEKGSANLFGNCPFTIHVLYKEEEKSWRYKLSPEKAKDYLCSLILDYLNRKQFDLIPFETVRKTINRFNLSQHNDKFIANIDSTLFKNELEEDPGVSEALPELIRLSKAKVPDDVFEKVKRRFSLFFEAENISQITKE